MKFVTGAAASSHRRQPALRGMILAAGLGTRLHPLTFDRAKPAVPFLNRPLIEYSLELMRRAGIQEIVINLHHAPQSIISAVQAYAARIEPETDAPTVFFSEEPEILGTGGGLGQARGFLGDGHIVLANGKIYFEEELHRAINAHFEFDALVTLILRPHSGLESFNPVLMDPDSNITGFALKSDVSDFSNAYIFSGVHILSPKVLDFIPPGPSDTVRDVYPRLIARGYRVRGYVSDAYWCECSRPDRYLRNSFEVLSRKGMTNLVESETGPGLQGVIAGPGVEVGRASRLEKVIIWERTRIGENSSLHNVIISSGLELPAETRISDAVITPVLKVPGQCDLEHFSKKGYMVWPLRRP